MMRNPVWTVVGVLLVGTMIALSAAINFSFGFSLGTTETNSWIYGGVSVVAVIIMAILPFRIAAHWNARQRVTAAIGGAMFGVLATFAIAGSIGFGIQNRSQAAGGKESLNVQLTERIAERDSTVERLRALGASQPPAAIAAQLEERMRDRRWDQTFGCTSATAAPSRDYCGSIDRLRSQLALAEEVAKLRAKSEALGSSIATLRAQGAGQVVDPQSFGFARLLRLEQETVRIALSILLSLVVETVSCFGLLVIVGASASANGNGALTPPEWVGRWLTDRAMPDGSSWVRLAELESDFYRWGQNRGTSAISTWRFRRLVRQACKEVGLSVQGSAVRGIRLGSGGGHIGVSERDSQ